MIAERQKGEYLARSKILSIEEVAGIVEERKRHSEKVGLITGCFDIVHMGHVILFREAKQYVDLLIIGLEMDKTILISKGPGHPINNFSKRSEMLAEMLSIDLIFPTGFVVKYGEMEENDKLYEGLYKKIRPDFLITDVTTDSYWREKQKRAKIMGIGFLGIKHPYLDSSTAIAKKIQESF